MNWIEFATFYGIGFGVEAISNLPVAEEREEDYVIKFFNGIVIDFLCFRILLGKITNSI